jgi:hypothetical protein
MANILWMGKPNQEIIVNTNRDLTGATSVLLQIKMPDGTPATWTPATYDIPSGEITYITNGVNDVTMIGEYVLQANVSINDVPLPPGNKGYFRVQQAIY